MTIYIIIPAHNEALNIVTVAIDAYAVLKKTGFNFKLIIIDDGSSDQTADLLNKLPFQDSIELLSNKKRCGLGSVLFKGLRHAISLSRDKDDIAITIEGDGTSDVILLPEIISQIVKGNDIVIASRFLRGSKLLGFSLSRKIFSYSVNYIFILLFKTDSVRDYTIFYRGYRISLLKKAFFDFENRLIIMKDFEGNAELLLKLVRYTENIAEIPLVYDYSLKKSKSKMNIILTIFRYFYLFYRQLILTSLEDSVKYAK